MAAYRNLVTVSKKMNNPAAELRGIKPEEIKPKKLQGPLAPYLT